MLEILFALRALVLMDSRPLEREELIKQLTPLPQVSFIVGPESTGRLSTVRYVVGQCNYSPYDVYVLRGGRYQIEGSEVVDERLTVDNARKVRRWALGSPHTDIGKIAIIRLGHTYVDPITKQKTTSCASTASLSILLKVLEEPPVHTKFVLISGNVSLDTVVSRCALIRVGLLTDQAVAQACQLAGYEADQAAVAAPLGAGRVRPVLEAPGADLRVVSRFMRDVLAGDTSRLATYTGERGQGDVDSIFTPNHVKLVEQWCNEQLSGRFRAFERVGGSKGRQVALRVGQLLDNRNMRPRLAVYAIFDIASK